MNTRQKLTLGIAAIFMVTLTIVGVTYAYFFTQVVEKGTDATDIVASTANISSIEYWEKDNSVLEIGTEANPALPGATPVEKVFGAKNPNTVEGSFKIALTTSEPTKAFIHSSDEEKDITNVLATCYKGDANTNVITNSAGCFDGAYYDNIIFDLYAADAAGVKTGNAIVSNVKVKFDAKVNSEQYITKENGDPMVFTIGAGTNVDDPETTDVVEIDPAYSKFVLVVKYYNRETAGANNQNLEFGSDLTIRVTIK